MIFLVILHVIAGFETYELKIDCSRRYGMLMN